MQHGQADGRAEVGAGKGIAVASPWCTATFDPAKRSLSCLARSSSISTAVSFGAIVRRMSVVRPGTWAGFEDVFTEVNPGSRARDHVGPHRFGPFQPGAVLEVPGVHRATASFS